MKPEARRILRTCHRLEADIRHEADAAALPGAPYMSAWAAAELAELVKFGPRYRPAEWFGGGRPLPEAERMRFLRAIQDLEARGLIAATNAGTKLGWIKLTPAGLALAAKVEPRPTEAPSNA